MMSLSAIMFYLISAMVLAGGFLAVTSKKIFRSAIWLLLSLIGTSAIYFWMQVEFIAAVQIVVYAGGITVLIIFSIFLTQQSGKEMPQPNTKRILASLLAALSGLAFTFNLFNRHEFLPGKTGAVPFDSSVSKIGTQMLSTTEHGYLLPFEVISLLLLSAMVGCIVIAIKSPKARQNNIDSFGNKSETENNITPLIPEQNITEAP